MALAPRLRSTGFPSESGRRTEPLLSRILSALTGAATFGISIFCISAWLTGHPSLASFGMPGAPMSFLAATGLGLFSIALEVRILAGSGRSPLHLLAGFVAVAGMLIGLAALLSMLPEVRSVVLPTLSAQPLAANRFPGVTTVWTSASLIILGSGMAQCLTRQRDEAGRICLDQLSALIALFLSAIVLTGYLFNAPLLHTLLFPVQSRGMTFGAAASLFLLAIGLLTCDPTRGVMRLLSSARSGGYMARRLVAVVLLAPPVLALLLHLEEKLDYFDAAQNQAITVILLSAVFLGLTWMTATRLDRAEELREESEERQKSIVERVPDIIYSRRIHPRPGFDFINPATETILGLKPEKFYSDPMLLNRITFPADAALLEQLPSPSDEDQKPMILRWIRPDGTLVWTETRRVLIRDASGRVIRIEGVMRDITAQKVAEEEREDFARRMEAERNTLERVIDLAPMAIVLVTLGGTPAIRLNRKARELLGSGSARKGGQWTELGCLYAPDGRRLRPEEYATQRALNGEEVRNVEEIVMAPDGKSIPVLVHATPIRDAGGRVSGSVTIFEDISVFRELERLREEWSSVIAHDLRQPIAAIGMQSELLKMQPENLSVVTRVADSIGKSARQLNRMTADLLDVSRLEARRLPLDRKPVRLQRILKEIVDRLGVDLQGRKLVISAQDDLPELWLDPGRFEQVIGNLISNAVKYGYPGTEIRVELLRSGNQAELSVTNQGKGIDPEELKGIFQRFHRTHWAKESKVKGVGLGLYITKGLVEAHGGSIEATSVPEKLTTFRVRLPLTEAQAA